MKKYEYERYDYAFLYGLLTDKQRESLQEVLNRFIGYPNNESTKNAVKMAVDAWLIENDINIKGKIKIEYE